MRALWHSLLLVSLIGCTFTPSKPPAPPAPVQKTIEIELKPIGFNALNAAIKEHKGKIVVLDVWSTSCIPCMKEFPHLVEMHKKHAGAGVVCMSLSLDEREDRQRALDFLKKQDARFANYWFEGKTDDELHNAWIFSGIPVVRVYDRNGELAKQFTNADPSNQFTYKDVEQLVATLLNK